MSLKWYLKAPSTSHALPLLCTGQENISDFSSASAELQEVVLGKWQDKEGQVKSDKGSLEKTPGMRSSYSVKPKTKVVWLFKEDGIIYLQYFS